MDLVGNRDRVEVIGQGRDGGVSERLTLWLQAHRRRVRQVTAVVVVVGVVAGIAVAAGRWYLGTPKLPHLVAARSTADTRGVMNARWESGDGGRPASRVHLAIQGEVTLRGLPAAASARTELLGLTGPGLDGALPTPVPVPGEGVPTAVVGDLEVSCDAVPLPVTAGRYGVRVQVTDGGRRSVGVVPAGDLATWLADAIGTSCGSWLAKRDVEVTAVTVTPDPGGPLATVALTVTNRGRYPVRLFPLGSNGFDTLLGDANAAGGANRDARTVPPGTTTVPATVTVRDCLEILSTTPPPDAPAPTTMDRLGLVGSAAADATQTTDGLHMFGDGVGPTGLVMGAQAAARMDALKATLCGGLGPPDLSVEVSRTRWDAARQELKLPLRLSISGGTVRAAILSDTTQNADGTELLTPSGSQFTVGGHGGALSLTLTYRRTGALLCDDAHHPELGGIGVDLLVAAGSGPRTVPLQFTLSGPSLPSLPPGLCA